MDWTWSPQCFSDELNQLYSILGNQFSTIQLWTSSLTSPSSWHSTSTLYKELYILYIYMCVYLLCIHRHLYHSLMFFIYLHIYTMKFVVSVRHHCRISSRMCDSIHGISAGKPLRGLGVIFTWFVTFIYLYHYIYICICINMCIYIRMFVKHYTYISQYFGWRMIHWWYWCLSEHGDHVARNHPLTINTHAEILVYYWIRFFRGPMMSYASFFQW